MSCSNPNQGILKTWFIVFRILIFIEEGYNIRCIVESIDQAYLSGFYLFFSTIIPYQFCRASEASKIKYEKFTPNNLILHLKMNISRNLIFWTQERQVIFTKFWSRSHLTSLISWPHTTSIQWQHCGGWLCGSWLCAGDPVLATLRWRLYGGGPTI